MSERNEPRKPEEIESDIHQTRARLDDTLHALEERFSPQQLMNASYDYLRHGGANEFFSNLGETIKQNPVPFMLTSAGLGWLMLAQRKPSHQRHAGHRHADVNAGYNDARGDRYSVTATHTGTGETSHLGTSHDGPGEPVHLGTAPSTHTTHAPTSGQSRSVTGAGTTSYGSDPASVGASATTSPATPPVGSGPGVGTGSTSGSGSQGKVGAMKDKSRHMTDSARDKGQQMTGKAREMMDNMKERTHQMEHSMRDKASHLRGGGDHSPSMQGMSHRARNAGSQTTDFIQEHPLVAGALGFAIGAALGGMFRSTRLEDEYMGPVRDQAMHRASEVGHEQAERAEEAVKEQAHKAQEKVHEKAEQAKSQARSDDGSQGKSGGTTSPGGTPSGVTKEETAPGGASHGEAMTSPSAATAGVSSRPADSEAARKGIGDPGSKDDDATKSGSRSTRTESGRQSSESPKRGS